ncbi:MAG: hypothetical protein HY318_12890 [Armatimonadetes bacterium]|nr:hypothetical protein [Armatimonadota bacterium]
MSVHKQPNVVRPTEICARQVNLSDLGGDVKRNKVKATNPHPTSRKSSAVQEISIAAKSDDIIKAAKTTLRKMPVRVNTRSSETQSLIKDRSGSPSVKLTERERNVLQTISERGTISATASSLNLSPRTVQTHLANVRHKTSLSTTVEIVAWAWRQGLIT